MLRKEQASECRNCKVLPSEAITTQHRILIADLVVKKTRQRRAAGRKRLRWWKLKDEETKEKFRRNLVERLPNIDEATTENVEQWWEDIAEQIKKCGEELCGRSTGKRKTGLESCAINWKLLKDSKTYIELQLQLRDRSGKDICQIRNVKSATGEVLMKDDEIKERWGQYFNLLMNIRKTTELEQKKEPQPSNDTEHQ